MKWLSSSLATTFQIKYERTRVQYAKYISRVDEDEIDAQCLALRKKLSDKQQQQQQQQRQGIDVTKTKSLKSHQVHELAQAKVEESERLRRALGIRQDYEEGSHWKRKEERLHDLSSDSASKT